MAILTCKACGYKSSSASGLKKEGKQACPQCHSLFEVNQAEKASPTGSAPKFKFKTRPAEQQSL